MSFLIFTLVHPFVWVCLPARGQVESYLGMAGGLLCLRHFPRDVSQLQLKRCNKKCMASFYITILKMKLPVLASLFPFHGLERGPGSHPNIDKTLEDDGATDGT